MEQAVRGYMAAGIHQVALVGNQKGDPAGTLFVDLAGNQWVAPDNLLEVVLGQHHFDLKLYHTKSS